MHAESFGISSLDCFEFRLKGARSRPGSLLPGFLVCPVSVTLGALVMIVKVLGWTCRDYFIERFDRKQKKNKAKVCVANSMNTEMIGVTVNV